jgi:hypothetical protein
MLQERAPKDRPPPRRSKRTSDDDLPEVEEPKSKKSKTEEKEDRESFTNSREISVAATQASLSQTESALNNNDAEESPQSKGTDGARTKKKRELNVGK